MSKLPLAPKKPEKKKVSVNNSPTNSNLRALMKEKTGIDIYETAKKKKVSEIRANQITKKSDKQKVYRKIDKKKMVEYLIEESTKLHDLLK